MASPAPSSKVFLDVDLTIVSAKHLKNVNWRHGELKPYAIAWFDTDCAFPTKVETSGGTKPVWNERFSLTLALSRPLHLSFLTIHVLHSNDAAAAAVPLVVGSARFPLSDALADSASLLTLDLLRPSGRPQGQIKLKIAIRERRIPISDPSAAAMAYSPPPAPPLPSCYLPSPPPPVQFRDPRDQSMANYVSPSQDGIGGPFAQPKPLPSSSSLPSLPPIVTRHFVEVNAGPSAPIAASPSSSSLVDYRDSVQILKGAKLAPEVPSGVFLKEEVKYGEAMRTEWVESAPPSRHG